MGWYFIYDLIYIYIIFSKYALRISDKSFYDIQFKKLWYNNILIKEMIII